MEGPEVRIECGMLKGMDMLCSSLAQEARDAKFKLYYTVILFIIFFPIKKDLIG